MVGGNVTHSTPTRRSAEPRSTLGQPGRGWWWTRPATSTAMKPPRVAMHPADGEDDEGGDDGAPLGLGPEALPLDDQEREDAGTPRSPIVRFRECQPVGLSVKIGDLAGAACVVGANEGARAAVSRTGPRRRPGPPAARIGLRPSWDTSRSCSIAGLILINGFFVAAEFALVKVRATQIDQLAEQGNWAAKLTSKALDRLDFYLSASQIGITVASLALGSGDARLGRAGGQAAFDGLHLPTTRSWSSASRSGSVPIAALSLVTFLHMALGEQAPKSLAIREPKVLALLTAPPLVILSYVFSPVIWLLEQGEQPDALGAGPGPDQHVRAGALGRGAAPDRGRERGRRPPFAQRADDDRERAEPRGEDRAAGDGPAAGHRLPEPGPAARGQPADRPPGGSHPLPALRGRPDDRSSA